MAVIATASKLLYFGNLFGYKWNLPQNNQKLIIFLKFWEQTRKNLGDFHKNLTDPGNGSGSVRIRQFLRIRILLAKKARIRIRATLLLIDENFGCEVNTYFFLRECFISKLSDISINKPKKNYSQCFIISHYFY